MTKAGVYKITHVRTGLTYVGQSLDCPARFAQHVRELNRRVHHNKKLQRLWDADGKSKFDFKQIYFLEEGLTYLENQIRLTQKELDYWWHYKSQGKSLNRVPPEVTFTAQASVEYETWKITKNKKITESLKQIKTTLIKIKDSAEPFRAALREKRRQAVRVEQILKRNVGWRRFLFSKRDDPPADELKKDATRLREEIGAIEPICNRASRAIRALEMRKSQLYRSYPGNIESTIRHSGWLPEIEKQRMVINVYYNFGILYECNKSQQESESA